MAKKKRHTELMSRPERQRLVVHSKQGETACGVCFALNVASEGFHLDLVDRHGQPQGKTTFIRFEELKAVFYVKSFDGKYDTHLQYREPVAMGSSVVVEFRDGEIMYAETTQTYARQQPRFHVIPQDVSTNNISVLVERSAIKGIYSKDEYEKRKNQELESYVQSHLVEGHSREELVADYHFDKHDYSRALKHYVVAMQASPDSARVRKKLISTHYNVGMRHIKNHEFNRATSCMKRILEIDPENSRAKRKLGKLKDHIKRMHAAANHKANHLS
jgi:tetratricopeptide (TPR) repeat protein